MHAIIMLVDNQIKFKKKQGKQLLTVVLTFFSGNLEVNYKINVRIGEQKIICISVCELERTRDFSIAVFLVIISLVVQFL